jgi:MEMO1 family protein
MEPMRSKNRVCLLALFGAVLFLVIFSSRVSQANPPAKKAGFAGTFYPAGKHELEKAVDDYLANAASAGCSGTPGTFAVMAPHAGFMYSGQVAACSYSALKGKKIRTVILLGSSHRGSFDGVAMYPDGSWETPLGTVSIDAAVAKDLAQPGGIIKALPAAFDGEHSLEVQLPFLQRTFKDVKIVPLLTGRIDKQGIIQLSDVIKGIIAKEKGRTGLVVSSDMSHYRSYGAAESMDVSTLKQIGELSWEGLLGGVSRGENELCAAPAVIAAVKATRDMNGEARVLGYANSGDTTGDRSRVVGYGSVSFALPEKKEHPPLTEAQKKTLLALARKTLNEYVSSKVIPAVEIKDSRLTERSGVFVTLNKQGQLRGCIGYIRPVAPLYRSVIEMTVAAASSDTRFLPVTDKETRDISIEISVLSPLTIIRSPNDIVIGKHGLYIVKGGASGLLLPQVATHYRWDREEFLRNTCSKAGLPEDAWKDKDARIFIFSAEIFSE